MNAFAGGVMTEEAPQTLPIRIDAELVAKIRVICSQRRKSSGRLLKQTEYLDSLIRQRIEADYHETLRKMTEAEQPKKKPKKES